MKLLIEKKFQDLPNVCRFWGRPKTANRRNAFQLSIKRGDKAKVEDTLQVYFPDPEDIVLVETHVTHTFKIKTTSADVHTRIHMAQATKTQKQSATATKSAAAKKGAAKKAAAAPAKKATTKKGAAAPAKGAEKGEGKIAQIIALHKAGKSNQQIVEAGFNKTTVSIQVSKYKREKAASKK